MAKKTVPKKGKGKEMKQDMVKGKKMSWGFEAPKGKSHKKGK